MLREEHRLKIFENTFLIRMCKQKRIVGFEGFTAVTTKNAVFWDVALCKSCVNRRFGGTYHLHLQSRKIRE
jgi:hypothetical protein